MKNTIHSTIWIFNQGEENQMKLSDFIKHTISHIDAYLDNYTIGTLIIDDGQAYLELDIGELITLDDSYKIEVINGDGKYHPITYHQAITTMCTDGWALYGGFKTRVRKKA